MRAAYAAVPISGDWVDRDLFVRWPSPRASGRVLVLADYLWWREDDDTRRTYTRALSVLRTRGLRLLHFRRSNKRGNDPQRWYFLCEKTS